MTLLKLFLALSVIASIMSSLLKQVLVLVGACAILSEWSAALDAGKATAVVALHVEDTP